MLEYAFLTPNTVRLALYRVIVYQQSELSTIRAEFVRVYINFVRIAFGRH